MQTNLHIPLTFKSLDFILVTIGYGGYFQRVFEIETSCIVLRKTQKSNAENHFLFLLMRNTLSQSLF